MNPAPRILILSLALFGWAVADLPKKAPISKYTSLYTNSPFTSKPPPPEAGDVINPLEDYALGGVSPISGGYLVTLLNKKKPEERITVSSDEVKPKHGFKILEVKRKSGDPLGTTVKLSSGSSIGTVSFEDKLLTLAPGPKAKAPPNAQPGQPPQNNQPPQPGQLPVRQPRPRVVPPPTPVAAPQVNPAGGAHPPGTSPQSNTRPDHRSRR